MSEPSLVANAVHSKTGPFILINNIFFSDDVSSAYISPLVKSVYQKLFFYISTKTYVVGTQKNCLNETVLF